MGDLLHELRPRFEDVAVAGDEEQRWPSTCANARKSSNFGSKIQLALSNGSGMRSRRMGSGHRISQPTFNAGRSPR